MKAGMMAVALVLLSVGCAANRQPNYEETRFQQIVAADTMPKQFQGAAAARGTDMKAGGRGGPAAAEMRMSEAEVQAEIDRQLAIKPSAPVPSRVLLLEIPTSDTDITSPRKKLLLRKETSDSMRKALEETGTFRSVDFLPDEYLPADCTDLKVLRLAAARAQADGLLIYSTESGYEQRMNGFAAFYPTIIGAFVAPGTNVASIALSKAVLVDVRTGYIYQVMEAYGEASGTKGMLGSRESLEFEARKNSLTSLAQAARERMKKMAQGDVAKP